MAKNRNKKKKNGVAPMDLAGNQTEKVFQGVSDMDTSEAAAPTPSATAIHTKVKNVQMKRKKNARKKKAIAKAVAKREKSEEKVLKSEVKLKRIRFAKTLYD
ncbi:unnamed protein product [Cuscuta campestris]|uniref:Uncharacterized protein n=1 Tax=Cuscuta campestris TaxID=132261 RepID=A0A484MSC0_9ASTE|nr:unnamed protein product [Cuscuta campestris]